MHRSGRVCTNHMRSTHGPLAYFIVYATLLSIESSLTLLIIIVHRTKCVCTNSTCSHCGPFAYGVVYTTLPSIEPSLGQFYGLSWLMLEYYIFVQNTTTTCINVAYVAIVQITMTIFRWICAFITSSIYLRHFFSR